MPKNKRLIGNIGEFYAKTFLVKHGFKVIQSNFQCFLGEIDIIAVKDKTLHFVEVKSVSRITFLDNPDFKPEDRVNYAKTNKIAKIGDFYANKGHYKDHKRQIDIICVYFIKGREEPEIRVIENVISG
jgi:putative endonuclease